MHGRVCISKGGLAGGTGTTSPQCTEGSILLTCAIVVVIVVVGSTGTAIVVIVVVGSACINM